MNRAAVGLLVALLAGGCETPPSPPLQMPSREAPVTQVTGGELGEDFDPEASPDGKLLFYASSAFGEDLDLFVKEVGSNTTTRLTRWTGDERFPKVCPANPRRLAFSSNSHGEWTIYVLEDYQGNPEDAKPVSEPGTHSIHPSWSPDGRFLVYCSADSLDPAQWHLKVADTATGKTRMLEVDGLLPEWSPEGNRIVFQRMRHRDRWFGSIWTLDFEGGEVRRLTALFSSAEWAAINPSWSPDARRVVFATVAKSRARADVLDEADDLWVVEADGSNPARITTSPAADWMPAWASDGRVYFASKRTGTHRIWSVRPEIADLR